MTHSLSLGAGVQSSTLALMAAHGAVPGYPTPDLAVFSDTQDEPASVYTWLDWLEAEIARCPHPFPVFRVTAGRLSERVLTMNRTADGRLFSKSDLPIFTRNADGSQGKIVNRACTRDFKIYPIMKHVRKWAKVPRKKKGAVPVVKQWIGISLDEVYRMKPSRDWWAENCWPLVDLRMSRHDCKNWMKAKGYPEPPRSSCVFCPFHSDAEWLRLKTTEPEAFEAAVGFEKSLQRIKAESSNFSTTPFLHRSLIPLSEVEFDPEGAAGQLDLWGGECEGMCGV